jgi:hypothetical protein
VLINKRWRFIIFLRKKAKTKKPMNVLDKPGDMATENGTKTINQ